MKGWCVACAIVVILVLGLFFIRLILPSQVDDVNPFMDCSDDVLELADVYFVVPKFENISVVDVEGWCGEMREKISSSRGFGFWGLEFGEDRLALHGVYHTFEEFGVFRDEEYFGEGVEIFEECFGFVPERFKPGQLEWVSENDWIRERMEVELFWNQLFHKVYHCGDTGLFPNWVVRVF